MLRDVLLFLKQKMKTLSRKRTALRCVALSYVRKAVLGRLKVHIQPGTLSLAVANTGPLRKRARSKPSTDIASADHAAFHGTLDIFTKELNPLMITQPVCNSVSKSCVYQDIAIFCQDTWKRYLHVSRLGLEGEELYCNCVLHALKEMPIGNSSI